MSNRFLDNAALEGTLGERPRLSIADVARRASVSPATVSRVMNGDSHVGEAYRLRVLDAVAELGYRPNRLARNLRKQRSAVIGVVVADIENPYFSTAIRAIEDAAFLEGYRVLVCSTDESAAKQDAYLAALEDERVLGVILSPSEPGSPQITDLLDAGIPVVALDRAVDDPRADAVLPDNVSGAAAATKLLIDSGHRAIAAVTGSMSVDTGTQRLAGYEMAMHAARLTPNIIHGGFRIELARETVTAALAESFRPSALFIANNLMVLGALRAIRNADLRVPDDVAIVGFDDPPWAAFVAPPLTTVAQPGRRMALDAVELLLERVTGRREHPRRIQHPLQLHLRASHAPTPVDATAKTLLSACEPPWFS